MKKTMLILAIFLLAASALADWQPVGPDGGYVQAMAIDPQHPAKLFAVPYDYPDTARLFTSTDGGANWSATGRMPEPFSTYLVVDPFADSVLYTGGRATVLYRSVDGGANWSPLTLPGTGTALACDPLTPGRIYVAGNYSYGGSFRAALYTSTNTGQSWTVTMPDTDTVGYGFSCGPDPVDIGTVYLGANGGKLYKTTDAGATWVDAYNGIPATTSVVGLSVNSGDNALVLAATSGGICQSTDGGANWSVVGSASYSLSTSFSPADPAVAYALGMTDSTRLHVSVDSGATWTIPNPGYIANKVAKLHPDPLDGASAWTSSTYGVHRTTDTGTNWNPAHTGLYIGTVSCISANPEDQRRLYLEMATIGVYRSECGGDTWDMCGYFLSCGNICGIAVANGYDRDILYALEGSG